MVSSRRLAREWALKILYQMDVGRMSRDEALDSALERLRREFVQRGSRTASGSQAEAVCLEWMTANTRPFLPIMRPPLERALSQFAGRILGDAPYWQELRLEKSLKTPFPGVTPTPARLLTPQPDSTFLLTEENNASPSGTAALSGPERAAFRDFVLRAREELPRLPEIDKFLRMTARDRARQIAANRPLEATGLALRQYLERERETFLNESADYWRKVSGMVQKQTSDWLRVGAFTLKLVQGEGEKQSEVDRAISALAAGWRLDRQVAVDRSILRLAGYELLFVPGIPTSATINEAVELAKKYSTAESGRFVNGVLGALAPTVGPKLSQETESTTDTEADSDDAPVDLPDTDVLEESE